MSSTVLEVTRAAHEEVERLERLIVKELQNEPGTNKERLYQSHRVRNMIDTITSTTEKLTGIYEDNDNARKDEIAALGGQTASGINVFSAFYDRLKEIREYHRKHPVARVVDANDDYETVLKEEPQIEFSGEEALGRYLDLHELYYQYVNSKFGEPLEYSAYVDVFSDTNKIPRKMKMTRQYREYMVNLLEYLIYFFQRTEPLQDLDRIFSKVTTEFEENWAAGKVRGWENDNQENGHVPAEHSTIDLDYYSTVEELMEVGPERLKEALAALGLKTGGTIQQRAERLFLTKHTPLEKLERKHFAKGTRGVEKNRVAAVPQEDGNSKEIALMEAKMEKLCDLLEETIARTKDNVVKKQALTYEEMEAEREEEETQEDTESEDDEQQIYNPLKLPMGWDGKPIPYWLYKLHGLGQEFKCEICGNYSYWGRRAFERHFKEWRHQHGMRCLGIPNTKNFNEITSIEEAKDLWIGLNGVKVGTTSSQAYLEGKAVKETRALMAELCRHFYTLGWVTGTGGSITMRVHDDSIPKPQQLILMSPSGVQKERMEAEDMYVLSNSGSILSAPSPKPYPHKPPKCTDCDPLFRKAYEMRDAEAVFHSHGIESCLVTMINPLSKEFRITHMEMIKGIKGHGYYDELVVPIIENTAYEYQLTESFAKAIEDYPKATAVLVRNHGVFVWGDSWISAKTQSECYHYLFDAALKLHQMGLDWSTPNHGPIQSARRGLISIDGESNVSVKASKSNGETDPFPRCIVLDIEGTTTPISFVSEVLFPYARDNVGKHLSLTYDTPDTKADIELLRSQVQSDLEQGIAGAVPIPPDDAGKEDVIAGIVANVDAMIKADRKITALKELQGHIWRTGYESNELEGIVFDDVPEALEKWHALGVKVYIYSSGSRLAQRLIFGKTNHGDLRKYLSGFFDTTVGNKRETRSYTEISESLGVDKPSDILFVTDVHQEATAAKAAGLEVIISIRPGNGPLPDNHGFKTIKSFSEI